MTPDIVVAVLMMLPGLILAGWRGGRDLLRWLDRLAQRRADRTEAPDDTWLDDQPAEVRGPSPFHDRLVCEQYEREFDQEAS